MAGLNIVSAAIVFFFNGFNVLAVKNPIVRAHHPVFVCMIYDIQKRSTNVELKKGTILECLSLRYKSGDKVMVTVTKVAIFLESQTFGIHISAH